MINEELEAAGFTNIDEEAFEITNRIGLSYSYHGAEQKYVIRADVVVPRHLNYGAFYPDYGSIESFKAGALLAFQEAVNHDPEKLKFLKFRDNEK